MSLYSTPSGDRIHIGIFGKRNVGKSSVINAITNQDLAIVSDVKGTTTDPVYKAMELLPLGAVMIIDTPGFDDLGELGQLRVKKSFQVLRQTDVAVLVIDAKTGYTEQDISIAKKIAHKDIPLVVAINKADLIEKINLPMRFKNEILVSAKTGENINELKELIAKQVQNGNAKNPIISDLIEENDVIVLVVPIDESAPKGRLILPQQQTIREILDSGGVALVSKEIQLEETLKALAKKPKMVVTDSQAFNKVSKIVPLDIPLTSFSILFARHKGDLGVAVQGSKALEALKDGDKVLISEGCTHHRQCNDIGTVKLPGMIRKFTGKKLEFSFTSGGEFPEDLGQCNLVVHCGACMLNEREMRHRIRVAQEQGVPITNYGIAIAHMSGILKRSVEVFPEIMEDLEK